MDEIIIVDYDPCWQGLFEEEAARVGETLGNDLVVAIEHIGSTAVPGLAAKPVIDLMIGVHSVENARSAVPLLEGLGYIILAGKSPPRADVFRQLMSARKPRRPLPC